MTVTFAAPGVPADAVLPTLRERGFAVLSPAVASATAGVDLAALEALAPSWEALPADTYLLDGGHYRRRRHACYVVDGRTVASVPHRAHWQSTDYNALHGGLRRWFGPVTPEVVLAPGWTALMLGLGRLFTRLASVDRWHVEAHQFRIDTSEGIGRPTPEGAHRDGVDFVVVALVARHGIKGGETRVFQADGPDGQRFTLSAPWSMLLLDDARVIHETTPIQPLAAGGHRDTLVLTYRAGGFQGD